jgi:hypothetical protein
MGGRCSHEGLKARLSNCEFGTAVADEIFQFVGRGFRVGGHSHRAKSCTAMPGNQKFDAVVHMDDDEIVLGHALLRQAPRKLNDRL